MAKMLPSFLARFGPRKTQPDSPDVDLQKIAGPIDASAHAIFIHGLNGSIATWQSGAEGGELWPAWLAADIPGLGVWVIGYKASASRWQQEAMHYADRASSLLARLLQERELQQGEISLVGYSFGGILAKAILQTAEIDKTSTRAQNFLSRTSRVIQIASPNAGSFKATLADKARAIYRPTQATTGLTASDPNLRTLNKWFRSWLPTSDALLVLTETRGMGPFGLVVSHESSDPGVGRVIPIDADHSSIVRVNSRHQMVYTSILDFLRNLPEVADARISADFAIAPRNQVSLNIDADHSQTVTPQNSAAQLFTTMPPAGTAIMPGGAEAPTEILDAALETELTELRAGRFLEEFPRVKRALRLIQRIKSGDLVHCSRRARAIALAWCARILVYAEGSDEGYSALETSLILEECEESAVAEAFFAASRENEATALSLLSQLHSNLSRSASLFVVSKGRSANDTLAWFAGSGLDIDDLDPEGRQLLLTLYVQQGDWESASAVVRNVQELDLCAMPHLTWILGACKVALTAPLELREVIFGQIPFQARNFPLSAMNSAIDERRRAHTILTLGARRARELGCARRAAHAEDLALWVQLRDPEMEANAIAELKTSMQDPALAIRRFALAMDFGIAIDLAAFEQRLEEEETLCGGATVETASARFVLVFTKHSPGESASYIRRYRAQMRSKLNPVSVLNLEIDFLVRANLREEAAQLLTQFDDELSTADQARIRSLISKTGEPDELLEAQNRYASEQSVPALLHLIDSLVERREWESVATYASILFEQSHDLYTFVFLTRALENTDRYERLYDELAAHTDLVTQSDELQAYWAWSLFRAGRMSDASNALTLLRQRRDSEIDRALFVNIAIARGTWAELTPFIEAEYGKRVERTGVELLRVAKLAIAIGSSRAEGLAREAAGRASGDPNILLDAYVIATSGGWEDDPEVAKWLHDAGALSGEEGPVQAISLDELVARQPAWQRGQEEALGKLVSGDLPMFAAGALIRRSLLEMILFEAAANSREVNSRARSIIPVRSGIARPPAGVVRSAALDPTAILVLASIGCFEKIIEALEQVVIPHGTLNWLFQERQGIKFHQPSRVREAQYIRDLLAVGDLNVVEEEVPTNLELRRLVGDELAELLDFAISRDQAGAHHIILRAGPVFRPGSLMKEEVDLTPFASVLRSCGQLVTSLVRQGKITRDEELRARSYLAIQEPGGSAADGVPPNTSIYVDSIGLGNLYHSGLLEIAVRSGYNVYAPRTAIDEPNAIIAYSRLSDRIDGLVDQIHATLEQGIASGKIRISNSFSDIKTNNPALNHPCTAVLTLSDPLDAIVMGDRALTRINNLERPVGLCPVVPVWDLLEALGARGALAPEVTASARLEARRANFMLLPISPGELETHLAEAMVGDDGGLTETAELRLIRENLTSLRMSDVLQIPQEASWLASTLMTIRECIRKQWKDGVSPELARARSEWLLALHDVKGWLHRYPDSNSSTEALQIFAGTLIPLLMPLNDVSDFVASAYRTWTNEMALAIERIEPKTFEFIVRASESAVFNATQFQRTDAANHGK